MSEDAAFDIHRVVTGCLAGHESSVARLVCRYHDLVFSLCLKMLGQRQDAEDATQETFTRVVRSLSQWDSSRRFEPWLLTVAGNRCRTKIAKRRRLPLTGLDGQPEISQAADTPGLILEEILVGLELLRSEYRVAFRKFHLEHRSFEEIAAELRVPYATVKTWCHRARKELAEILLRRGNLAGEMLEPAAKRQSVVGG